MVGPTISVNSCGRCDAPPYGAVACLRVEKPSEAEACNSANDKLDQLYREIGHHISEDLPYLVDPCSRLDIGLRGTTPDDRDPNAVEAPCGWDMFLRFHDPTIMYAFVKKILESTTSNAKLVSVSWTLDEVSMQDIQNRARRLSVNDARIRAGNIAETVYGKAKFKLELLEMHEDIKSERPKYPPWSPPEKVVQLNDVALGDHASMPERVEVVVSHKAKFRVVFEGTMW
ncbi:hypothetical protein BDV95DRAFT_608273 [Massariosphaeria phaeospora]|uniref:Uncharacterized protein n=1 Tax=Massariosphaeria phaeospora TaxID=100035 RepID=A0A7C8I8Z2_9PLEO|nr:hypothetical protein BDV95DRAFT_608273 [Massariosphaeria phaeospora]